MSRASSCLSGNFSPAPGTQHRDRNTAILAVRPTGVSPVVACFSGARPSRLCGQQASRLLLLVFSGWAGETPTRHTAETAVLQAANVAFAEAVRQDQLLRYSLTMQRRRYRFEIAAAYCLGVALPVFEVCRRRTNFSDIPGYIDDFIIGGLLLFAARSAERGRPHGRALLVAAWGIL